MNESEVVKTALLNAPELARLAGVSVHTVRAVIAGKRTRLYPSTRAKLAAAFRAHSSTLAALADEIECPT